MSLIHQVLYEDEDFSNIDFNTYLDTFIKYIFKSYKIKDNQISLVLDIQEDLNITINNAVPCALLLNELLSNSLEHAFNGIDEGEIFINIMQNEGSAHIDKIVYRDNGIGMDTQEEGKLGTKLIQNLCKQNRLGYPH